LHGPGSAHQLFRGGKSGQQNMRGADKPLWPLIAPTPLLPAAEKSKRTAPGPQSQAGSPVSLRVSITRFAGFNQSHRQRRAGHLANAGGSNCELIRLKSAERNLEKGGDLGSEERRPGNFESDRENKNCLSSWFSLFSV
jgi:hypothetical protein